jgi:hypothetical protein
MATVRSAAEIEVKRFMIALCEAKAAILPPGDPSVRQNRTAPYDGDHTLRRLGSDGALAFDFAGNS